MNQPHRGIFLVLLVSFLGASLGVVNKIGIEQVPPIGFVTSRVVLSLIFVLPLIIREKFWQIKHKFQLFAYATLATLNITLFILGLAKTTVSIAAVLYTATPLVTAVLSTILYQESLTQRKISGVLLGLIGTMIIILTPVISTGNLETGNFWGNLIILAAVMSFSVYTALSKLIQRQFSPIQITLSFILTSVAALLPLAIWELGLVENWLVVLSFKSVLAMLYVSLIGTVFYYFLYQYVVAQATPLIASLAMYLQPVFGVVLALIVFQERLTSEFLIGSGLTFLGVWLVTTASKNPEKMVKYRRESVSPKTLRSHRKTRGS